MLAALLLLAVGFLPAEAAEWDPGAVVTDAASFQVTERGLQKLGDMVSLAVPQQIAVPPQSTGTCDVSISNMWVQPRVDDLRLITSNGRMDLEADLTVWVNDDDDPFQFDNCVQDCNLYIEPFPVQVSMPLVLDVVYDSELGHNVVDVTTGEVAITHQLTQQRIESSDTFCAIDLILDGLDSAGVDLVTFLYDLAEPVLLLYIQDQKADIEADLEAALSAAYFEDTIDLQGTALEVMIEPQDVVLVPTGLEVITQGRLHADQGACMVDRDPEGSTRTDTPLPEIADNPPNTEFGVLVSDDVANQGLYAVWRSGLFCFDLSESGDIELPFPLNSSLLGIVGGEGFEELFPENQPLDVMTSPDAVPTAAWDGTSDVTAQVRELGVDFYTDVDYRKARALGVDLEVDAGLDLAFDGATGELALDIAFASEDVTTIPEMNELVAGSDQAVQDNFGEVLDVVIDQFLGDALDDQSFLIPSFEADSGARMGLNTLSAAPAGAESDWLRARAGMGQVQYDNADADNACGEGCSTGSAGGPWGLLVLIPLLGWRRRA